MINHNNLKRFASVHISDFLCSRTHVRHDNKILWYLTVQRWYVGRLLRDVSMYPSDTTPVSHTKTVISFQLSNCAPKENIWSVEDCTHKQRSSGHWANNEPSTLGSFEFGLTHHEVHELTNFHHIRFSSNRDFKHLFLTE